MGGPSVLDLFCGAGGFSRGFEEAGYEVVGGIDVDPVVAETFRLSFPSAKVVVQDIRELSSWDLVEKIGEEPEVVIGGPPCEPFTRTNAKRMRNPLDRLYTDPDGMLILHFIRLVGDLRPKVFVMENVVDVAEGPLADALRAEFRRVGYSEIYFNLLRAEEHNTPSIRRRLFISNVRINPPKSLRRLSVLDAIGDLPSPYSIHDIPNHEPTPLPQKKLKRVTRVGWGGALMKYRGATGKFKNFMRLNPFMPAPPVTGLKRFIHPFEDRMLTVREHARLMGFPDHHVFLGNRELQYNQVGEAVPVPLAREIAAYLLDKVL